MNTTPDRNAVIEELPPLPLMTAHTTQAYGHVRVEGYTSEQMKEYALAAIRSLKEPEQQEAEPVANVDEIVTRLYRRFKDWSQRGFGPDDVTWCEVKADVLAIVAQQAPESVPVAWKDMRGIAMMVAEAAYKEGCGRDRAIASDKLRFLVDEVLEKIAAAPTHPVSDAKDAQTYPAVMLTRDTKEMCEVSLEIDGKWVPVLRDNGTIISHTVEPLGVKRAINAAIAAQEIKQ